MKELEYKIYGLKIKDNNRIYYVGRTSNLLSTRLSKHKTNAKLSRTNNYRANWINKHGDEIEIVLIEGGIKTKQEACEKEIYYIAFYKEKFGSLINATIGGDGGCEGYKHSAESKKKIGDAHRGISKPYVSKIMSNRKVTKETLKKMSDNTKKQIEKFGNPMLGKKRPDNIERNKNRKGWKHKPETIEKFKESRSGKNNHNYKNGYYSKSEKEKRKRIYKLTKEDVVFIRELYKTGKHTYKEIGKLYNVSGIYISQIVRKVKWSNV